MTDDGQSRVEEFVAEYQPFRTPQNPEEALGVIVEHARVVLPEDLVPRAVDKVAKGISDAQVAL